MKSKKEYMEERGLFDKTAPEYAEAEKEYNRLYQKVWREENNGFLTYFKSGFHNEEETPLVRKTAKDKNISIARLIRESTLAACRGSYYTPPPELLPKAITAIETIGNLINQQTRWIHTNHKITERNYQDLLDYIENLKKSIKHIYYNDL